MVSRPVATLGAMVSFCIGTIVYVHYIQKADIEVMKSGVYRDIEREKQRRAFLKKAKAEADAAPQQ